MQTRSLKTLVKIAQVNSFAVAAEQLNMTLSAVSMQMKSLENELGVLLFDREYRPPKLTPLGRSVVRQAGAMIHEEDTLMRICNPDDRLTGRFRLGFVTTASTRLLPAFLKHARKKAPDATFDLESGLSEPLERKVSSGQLDAAVITLSGEVDRRLRTRILREEQLVFAGPRGTGAGSLNALIRTTPFLHFMPNTGIGRLIAEEMSKSTTGDLHSKIILDSVEAIMECVKQGIGFTLLPEPDVKRYSDDSVQVIYPKGEGIRRKLALVSSSSALSEPAAALLADLLVFQNEQ